jgi:hypothetical protein
MPGKAPPKVNSEPRLVHLEVSACQPCPKSSLGCRMDQVYLVLLKQFRVKANMIDFDTIYFWRSAKQLSPMEFVLQFSGASNPQS